MPKKGESKYKYEISTDKEPTKFIIYKCTNLVNGKIYIGQTSRLLTVRMARHKSDMVYPKNLAFKNALVKYGFENFKWELIDYAKDKEDLSNLEIHYIYLCNSFATNKKGYNLTIGGEGTNGYIPTKEQLELHSKKLKLYYKDIKNREKLSLSHGSKPFNVYNNTSLVFIGSWINCSECSQVLKIGADIIRDCLTNYIKINKNYIFIYQVEDSYENRFKKHGERSNWNYKEFNVYDRFGKLITDGKNLSECARKLNIGKSGISACLNQTRDSYLGLVFIYKSDDEIEYRNYKISKIVILYKTFNVYDFNNNFIIQCESQTECAKLLDMSISGISTCLLGKYKQNKGYKFYYIENDPNLTTQIDKL